MTTATMETPIQTEEERLAAWDAKVAAKRVMVLTLTVDPADWDVVHAAVTALRSGLCAPDRSDMKQYAWSYYGPFEVDALDRAIVEAVADYCDGIDEGPDSDDEPHIIQGRLIRLAARSFAANLKAAGA